MAMTKDSKSPVSHLETVYSTYDPSRSVFSPYRSPYTLDLEALQNVIAEVLSVLGNLFINIITLFQNVLCNILIALYVE